MKSADLIRSLGYTRGIRFKIFLCVASVLILAGLDVWLLPVINHVVTSIANAVPISTWLIYQISGYFILRSIFGYLSIRLVYNAGQLILKMMRDEVYQKTLTIKMSSWQQYSSSEISSMLTYNSEQILRATTFCIRTGLVNSFTILFSICYLAYISYSLFLLVLAFSPLLVFLIRRYGELCHQLSLKVTESVGVMSRYFDQSYNFVSIIRMERAEKNVCRTFAEKTNDVYVKSKKYNHISAMLHVGAALFLALPIVVTILLTSFGYISVTAAILATFLFALIRIMPQMRQMSAIVSDLQRGMAAAHLMYQFLDSEDESYDGLKLRCSGDLVFKDVSFFYKETPVLENLNVVFKKGLNGLVGASGAGKSTLLSLLCRLIDCKGSITCGGVSIHDIALKYYRQSVSLLSQDVAVFDGTLKYNVLLGEKDYNAQQYKYAIAMSGLDDITKTLMHGDKTVLGPSQSYLSGGQLQRLALARALYKKSAILLLDEPTSAVDHQTSHQIMSRLQEIATDRVVIVVTHDKSLLKYMDCVHYLHHGQVSMSGKHDELWAASDSYRSGFLSEAETVE